MVRLKKLLLVVIISSISLQAYAQHIMSLSYLDSYIIPFDLSFNNQKVGGLSAITNGTKPFEYLLAVDKPPARIFKCRIVVEDSITVNYMDVLMLMPNLLASSELEGIVKKYDNSGYYLSDEQKVGTRIFEVNQSGDFVKIIEPKNMPFLELSNYNSGIEGLTSSANGRYLIYAFERPTAACIEQSSCALSMIDLQGIDKQRWFYYQLHPVLGDALLTNGISDILAITDTTLLVMERAYLVGQGNRVRLYLAKLDSSVSMEENENCRQNSVPLESELLFDFGDVQDLKIDNAEGMTFSADKSLLLLITDNNFSRRQQSQIVALKIDWQQ